MAASSLNMRNQMRSRRIVSETSSYETIDSDGAGWEILCYCNRPAKLLQAWTDENPWRKFYGCANFKKDRNWCDFFSWHDIPQATGWAKSALLEARNKIREKNSEIKELSRHVVRLEEECRRQQRVKDETDYERDLLSIQQDVDKLHEDWNKMKTENLRLEAKCLRLKSRCETFQSSNDILRLILILSWVLFAVLLMLRIYGSAKSSVTKLVNHELLNL